MIGYDIGSHSHYAMVRLALHLVRYPVLAVAMAGCAGQLPAPTGTHADRAAKNWPGTTLADLHAGRRLYIDHCSGCHSLYLPSVMSSNAWPGKVHEMKGRAQLGPVEADLVIRYLVALTSVETSRDLASLENPRSH